MAVPLRAVSSVEKRDVAIFLSNVACFREPRRSAAGRLALYILLVLLTPLSFFYAVALLYGAVPNVFLPRRTIGGRTRGVVSLLVWRFELGRAWRAKDGKRETLIAEVGRGELLFLRLPVGAQFGAGAPRLISLFVYEGEIVGWEHHGGLVRLTDSKVPVEVAQKIEGVDYMVVPTLELGWHPDDMCSP